MKPKETATLFLSADLTYPRILSPTVPTLNISFCPPPFSDNTLGWSQQFTLVRKSDQVSGHLSMYWLNLLEKQLYLSCFKSSQQSCALVQRNKESSPETHQRQSESRMLGTKVQRTWRESGLRRKTMEL
jgi:hypothetical protein